MTEDKTFHEELPPEEVEPEEIDPETAMILVGFGKHDLKDMLTWQDTDKENDLFNAPALWPPRWRRMKICDQDEIKAMGEYFTLMSKVLGEK